MTTILATRSGEARIKGEALIRTADQLLCGSWNGRMWADGEPIDPSPTIDQVDGRTDRSIRASFRRLHRHHQGRLSTWRVRSEHHLG